MMTVWVSQRLAFGRGGCSWDWGAFILLLWAELVSNRAVAGLRKRGWGIGMEPGREEVGKRGKEAGVRRATEIRGYWDRGRTEGHPMYFGKI